MNALSHYKLSTITTQPVSWLWPGRIPRGKVTMLTGDPGLGKSFVTMDLAARVSTGAAWPDGSGKGMGYPADVLILSAEDDPADTIRPRLEAAGGDPDRITICDGVIRRAGEAPSTLRLDEDVEALRQMLEGMHQPALVIIDPISAYMGGVDSHNNADVRSVLAGLARIAMDLGPAIVCISHLSKASQGLKAVYRQMGSLAFTAAARIVWQVSKLGDDERAKALSLVKSNLPSVQTGLAFSVEGEAHSAKVVWGTEALPAGADVVEDEAKLAEHEALPEAATFLRSMLEAGPAPALRVMQAASEAGIAPTTLRRAKKSIGVRARRAGGNNPDRPWVWSIGEDAKSQGEDFLGDHPRPQGDGHLGDHRPDGTGVAA
jgi:putative DNA primase/helicase